MLWLFHDPNNREESRYVARTLTAFDDWWKAFAARDRDLNALFRREQQWDLPQFMEDHLQAVHPQLMWEFGQPLRGEGHRLVITPESERWLRPLVGTLLARAPQLPGWEFYSYRMPDPPDDVPAVVAGRTGLAADAIHLSLALNEQQIDVTVSFATDESSEEELTGAAFVACEALFGEEWLDRRIGVIEGKRLAAQAPRGLLTPHEAVGVFRDLLGEIEAGLPTALCSEVLDSDAKYSLLEMGDPHEISERGADFPQRSDLFTLGASRPEIAIAAVRGVFHSANFSRFGETFAYLKIDGSEGLEGSQFADRSDIEEAVDQALRSANLGCVIGGGTGVRYSYVDLALTQLPQGAQTIRQALLQGGIPQRTWLLFFDDALAAEWFAIHEKAPAPPEGEQE